MDLEKLGLSRGQQTEVDLIFLDTIIMALCQKTHYRDRAYLVMLGDTADELEAIFRRAYENVHDALLKDRKISPAVLQLLGKLTFIDSLALPSSERLKLRARAMRALGDFADHRRLFAEIPA
jgi:hypothetical protein